MNEIFVVFIPNNLIKLPEELVGNPNHKIM